LDENHGPPAGPGIDAEEKAGIRLAGYMNLFDAEVFRFERFEEVGVFGFSGIGRKRHTEALMDLVEVSQPQAPWSGAIRVATRVNYKTGKEHL
jgi:hypothetical protein